MKKKLAKMALHRETLRSLAQAALPAVATAGAGLETGSNPHSACATCTLANCPNPTA